MSESTFPGPASPVLPAKPNKFKKFLGVATHVVAFLGGVFSGGKAGEVIAKVSEVLDALNK